MKRVQLHEIAWLALIFLTAIAIRAAFLAGNVAHLLRSDEATNGVVALDILKGGAVPFFQYEDRYGGGQVVESLLMVPVFRFLGASEISLKAVPAAESIIFLLIFFVLLRRHFPSRTALAATGLLALSAPFVALSFTVYGNMATGIAGWLGLAFAIESVHRSRPHAGLLFLSGLFFGFSYYCHPSSMFLIAGTFALLAVSQHRLLLGGSLPLAAWVAGLLAGAAPLLLYHLRFMPSGVDPSSQRGTTLNLTRIVLDPGLFLRNWWHFFSHDLPYFFSIDVFDFAPRVSLWSWAAATAALVLAAAGIAGAGRPFQGWPACWRQKTSWAPNTAGWTWVWLGFVVLFSILYSLHPRSGMASRYLIPVFPFLVLLVAWGVDALWQRRPAFGAAAALLFLGLQVPLLAELAQRRTTTEWGIEVNALDVHRVQRFLEEQGYSYVLAPYEIKWKLLFLSAHRIKVSSSLFGFDREKVIDREVLRKIDAGEAPLVIVLDRELRYPLIGQSFNPAEAFYPDEFFGFLQAQGMTHEAVPLGDFVVLHRFSKGITFTRKTLPE